tara:strand:- start:313 stop:693 length:381 start_codon:yes stop_codon:yes gene_type:complete
MKDRFNLENEIMDCWGVVEDLDTIIESLDSEFYVGIKPEHADRLANILIGVRYLYDTKFEQMFKTFGECVSELDGNSYEENFLDNISKTTTAEWTDSELRLRRLSDVKPSEWDALRDSDGMSAIIK